MYIDPVAAEKSPEQRSQQLPEQLPEQPPEQPDDVTAFESAFIKLEESVQKVASIADPIQREYEMTQEAKRLDIPLDSYRRIFDSVVEDLDSRHQFLRPLKQFDYKFGTLIENWKGISVFKLVALIGEITVLLAMGSYFIDAPRRHKQAMDDAKQTVKQLEDNRFSQDRIDALTLLAKNCEDMTGVKARDAVLSGIQLDRCYPWKVNSDSFKQFPPQFRQTQSVNLSFADFSNSDLEGASLKGVNLQGANLANANLTGANLSGANLTGANLEGANLHGANLEGAVLAEANLKNADLGRARLTGADLQRAIAPGATLLWADLAHADLHKADLAGANLNRADLRGAELYQTNLSGAALRYADLRDRANLRQANIANADLREARFWSVSQLQRAQAWQQSRRDPDWETRIAQPRSLPQIVLVQSNSESIYQAYAAGIKQVSGAEFTPVLSDTPGVEAEAKTIEQLIAQGVDGILIRPEDPNRSVTALQAAYEAGIAVITIGECLNPTDAARYVFACYESDSFQMGYDLTRLMLAQHKDEPLNLGLLDGSELGRSYAYFRGFEQAMAEAKQPWTEVASTAAFRLSDLDQVKAMLQKHPTINLLWAGTHTATAIAVQAVNELGLQNRVKVYGVTDLTPEKAKLLLDPNAVLDSIVDEHPQEVGAQAAATAVAILQGNPTEYQRHTIPHRVLGTFDRQAVEELLQASP